jgi:chemotaxis protein methyltransferase CheR
MNANDYEYISNFLVESSGLALGEGKEYLLEARLIPLAQSFGLSGISELILELRRGNDLRLSTAVTESMTTNETSFFRDNTPFEELKTQLLPALINARRDTRSLRIWCAAASTGQEIYSLLMLIDESFPELRSWKIDVVATDIAQKMLTQSQEAVYTQFEVQRGLPTPLLIKYFEQVPKGWRIKDSLRDRVLWKQQNLLSNFQHLGPFDLIVCRNVLIYFEVAHKQDVLERMRNLLPNDSYLLLGAAESVVGVTDQFDRYRECRSAVYTPR